MRRADGAAEAPGPELRLPPEQDELDRSDARSPGLSPGWVLVGVGVLLSSFAIAPGVEGAFGGGLGLLMLGVASADARRFVVPNALSGGAFALGLVHSVIASPETAFDGLTAALARAALTAGALWAVRIAYRWLRGRDGLGLGDVKLAGAAGAWLSLPILPVAIEIAALAALAAYVLRQRRRMRVLRGASRVPFGAFLAPAIWLGWVLETTLPYLG